jgi:RNA polymerase sigma-70 factor (ECF subfamily)
MRLARATHSLRGEGVDEKRAPPQRDEESDEALLGRVASGDLEALGDLFVRHGPLVRAALARFAPDIAESELDELAQEVFLAIAGAAREYRGASRFTTWLYGIAIRKARSHRRGKWTRNRLRERHGEACAGVSPQRSSDSPEHETMIREAALDALSRLSEPQRVVVWLHAVEGMNGEEIATALGISPRTVWTRLHRARRRLSRELAGANDEKAKGET